MANINNTCHISKGQASLDTSQVLLPRPNDAAFKAQASRVKIYNLRFKAAEAVGGRLSRCGCSVIASCNVSIQKNQDGKMFYSGLETCGSVWSCPVCALKITQQRAKEVYDVLSVFQKQPDKYSLGFLTLTTRHHNNEGCRTVKKRVLDTWRKIQQSRIYRTEAEKNKHLGDIRALEVKWSNESGWHPHLHIALISECNSEALAKFASFIVAQWCNKMKEQASEQGQKYIPIYTAKGISNYITKWDCSSELTKGHTKTESKGNSLTPFQLLEAGLTKQFQEYHFTFKGSKQLTFSRNLKRMFLHLQKEDEEIAQEQQEGATIQLNIDKQLFSCIALARLQAYVINVFEFEGLASLQVFLMECGIFTEYDQGGNILQLEGHKELKLLPDLHFDISEKFRYN
jgi:pyrimidine deaminase RibD-like protein